MKRDLIARRFIIKGRVQGVGFRYFTVRAARSSGVSGTVRNMPDGSVEAIAEGSEQDIREFHQRLSEGPGLVQSMQEIEIQPSNRRGFEVIF